MKKNKHKICQHCGGAFRHDAGEVSCLMCSRSENHKCDKCLFIEKSASRQIRKKQYKAA